MSRAPPSRRQGPSGAARVKISRLRRRLAQAPREGGPAASDEPDAPTLLAELGSILEELDAALADSDAVESDWAQAFDVVTDPMFFHDQDYRIIHANHAYAERAGCTIDELVGRPYWEVFPQRQGPLPGCARAREGMTEEQLTTPDGVVFRSRGFVVSDPDGQYRFSIHVLEDITDTERAREAMEAHMRRQAALVRLSRAALQHTDLDTVMHAAAEESAAAMGADDCVVLELLPSGEALRLRAGAGRQAGPVGTTVPATMDSQPGYSLQSDEPVIVEDVRTESRFQTTELLNKHHAVSAASVPIPGPEGPFGVLCADSREARWFSQAEADFLQAVAHLLAIAIRRVHNEERLAESNQLLETMFAAIDLKIAYMDAEFNFIRVNQAYAEADDRTPDFFRGKNHFDLYPNADNEAIFRQVVANGEPYTAYARPFVYPEHSDWGTTYWDWRLQPVKGPDGATQGLLLTLNDVTDRERAEQGRRESLEQFRAISAAALDAILVMNDEGRLIYWNPAAQAMFGYASEEVLGKDLHEVLAPSRYREDARQGVARFRESGTGPVLGEVFEREAVRKDGTEFPVELSVNAMLLQGRWHAVGVVRDITERKASEQALQHAQDGLEQAQRIARLGNWDWDIASGRLWWSDEVYHIFGLDPEAFSPTYEAFLERVDPADRELVTSAVERALAHDERYGIDYRVLHPDGTPRVIHAEGQVIRDEAGEPVRMIGTVQDVTESRQTEAALERANRAHRTLSRCNEVLVRAQDEQQLLDDICRTAVEVGGYRLAWVGFVEHDPEKRVRPVARAGYDEGYVDQVAATWERAPRGAGPVGRAIRAGEPIAVRDVASDEGFGPWREAALARGYGSLAAFPITSDGETLGTLTVYASVPNAFDQEELRLLQELSRDLGYGIGALRTRQAHERAVAKQRDLLYATIESMALTIEKRDPYTAGHQQRVAVLSAAMGSEMALGKERIEGLRLAALIHDIGKIHVPSEILTRPGRLTRMEFELVKAHAEVGHEIVQHIPFPWPVAQMIFQHHERLDGSGYPQGLTADQILLESKILAVADVVEAIASHRPYRPAPGLDAALEIIHQGSGVLFEPSAVDACVRLFREKGFQWPADIAATTSP